MQIITSLLFLTNSLHAIVNQKIIYGLGFLVLTLTSVGIRRLDRKKFYMVFNLDLLALLFITFVGFYYFLQLPWFQQVIPFLFFISVNYIHFIGYLTNEYNWDPDEEIGDFYHGFIHVLSIVGHHLILTLVP